MSGAANPFTARWAALEAGAPGPKYLRAARVVPYEAFKARVLAHDLALADELYAGDIFILKNVFTQDWCKRTAERVFAWGQGRAPSFHKMLDGCPDFHRIIDPQVSDAYASKASRHGYYFFRWNGDPVLVFEDVTARWRVFKTLSGLRPDEYEANLPRDLVVDRLIFYRYPLGTGGLKVHADPINNHKIVMGGFMCTRGVDFQRGGIFFMAPGDRKVDVEAQVAAGDFMITYPTVLHGVDTVDPGTPLDWTTPKGRWFIGLSSVDTDYGQERQTTVTVEEPAKA